ncbi:hypothetical protein [Actinoplanes regularis]|uniref:Uncharacterized protein n=1 Tax=Actinoplanes regularis TaxID=52697 RepID=A0A238WQV1_9ACTN|nr:hypothetical protein [Actinoplanes regularis]GIE84623.1 hypothetical protein Are01nite_11030 [Actinoplanes regularis]GLW33005.1 hypothetical protein Areg01_59430 [Actinoplanes regularis]SNR48788.1 hypothetical protein SAMN06264365_102798 [Actinoplanes regularis]
MRSLSKVLLTLSVAFAGVLAVISPAAAASSTPEQLGGLDVGAYCRSIGYSDAALTGSTAYDWHCVAGDGSQHDLTFEAACRWAYGTDAAVDRIDNFNDPKSVKCWRVTSTVVAPAINDYCVSTGHSASALLGSTVYDWHCVNYSRVNPVYFDVSLPAVCRYTTGTTATIDRFVNFRNSSTWQCRV